MMRLCFLRDQTTASKDTPLYTTKTTTGREGSLT